MTNRDSDTSCLPPRAPQHAAPLGFHSRPSSGGQVLSPGRLRRLSRRVHKLLITTLAWGTGLGLVVGAIMLVAMATDLSHAAPTQGAPQFAGAGMLHGLPYAAAARGASSHSTRDQSNGKAGPSGHQLPVAGFGHARLTTPHVHGQPRWRGRCGRPAAEPRRSRPHRSCLPPDWHHSRPGDPQGNSQ
jgi:hypothetical protein